MLLSGNEDLHSFMDKVMSETSVSKHIHLPMIGVMGDTSSAKSSLLSQISGVNLPSSSEITTRCPLVLQMIRSDEQKATVSVAWNSTQNEYQYFEPVTVHEDNWTKLPIVIASAQSHIIKCTGKEVARDKVHVHVSGPTCEDLTLIDLPGIVRSRGEGESKTIVQDIEALMGEYLKNQRCVILAVVPANVDFHNSQIMADAKQVDPDGARTIPVITKPDLIDPGSEGGVMSLLLGEQMKFQHGFHMIKGRGQAALNLGESIDQALDNEERYFASTEPWCSVEDRTRFGTALLRRKLGMLQMKMFREEIPKILREIESKKLLVEAELEAMGKPLLTFEDRRLFYTDVVRKLVAALKEAIDGGDATEDRTKPSVIHEAAEVFKATIEGGTLAGLSNLKKGDDVRVPTANGIVRGKVVHSTESEIFVDYEDRENKERSEFVLAYKVVHNRSPTPTGDSWVEGDQVFVAREDQYCDMLRAIPSEKAERDPTWMKSLVKNQRSKELPIFPSSELFNRIVKKFIDEEWKPACLDLAGIYSDVISKSLLEALQKVETTTTKYPRLHDLFRRLFSRVSSACRKDANGKVEGYISRNEWPFSQNDFLSETICNLMSAALRQQLLAALEVSSEGASEAVDREVVGKIVDAVFYNYNQRSLDEYSATSLLHGLQGYGVVAANRFIDEIPALLWEVANGTVENAESVLWAVTDDELERAMKEGSEFERNYRVKADELKELDRSLELFNSLHFSL